MLAAAVTYMKRVYNFSAGPACLPEWVLRKAAEEMLDARGSGMSVMEMSHRSKAFEAILHSCEQRLRRLMQIPDTYDVLFIQGGASLQFTMIPLQLLKHGADIIHTGQWSKKAIAEHRKLGKTTIVASSEDANFTYIPKIRQEDLSKDSDYLYICENNTIYGTKYHELPPHADKLLVADVSSCILSEPIDVNNYDLLFAGAQKNMGIAGVTVVIVKKTLIQEVDDRIPSMLSYRSYADNDSMYNTPPTYAIYMMDLVLEWLETQIGGLAAMGAITRQRAERLYAYLDRSTLFHNPVEKADRSYTNIPFITGDKALDRLFIQQAEAQGLVNLKGHRSVGGMRASLYNAMSMAGVDALLACMEAFEREHGGRTHV